MEDVRNVSYANWINSQDSMSRKEQAIALFTQSGQIYWLWDINCQWFVPLKLSYWFAKQNYWRINSWIHSQNYHNISWGIYPAAQLYTHEYSHTTTEQDRIANQPKRNRAAVVFRACTYNIEGKNGRYIWYRRIIAMQISLWVIISGEAMAWQFSPAMLTFWCSLTVKTKNF